MITSWRRRAVAALAALAVAGPAAGARAEGLAQAARAAGLEFGVALAERDLDRAPALVRETFTSITPENALKWRPLAPEPGRREYDEADAIVAFAEAAGMRVRGHALLWSRLNGPPRWLDAALAAAPDPAFELDRLVAGHVAATVGRYAGRIAQWDVVNEPFAFPGVGLDRDNVFLAVGGREIIAETFRRAAAADPAARLYLNEIGLEQDDVRFTAFVRLVEELLAEGAPIHGVGLQGHFRRRPPDPGSLRLRLDRLGALGLDVEITELDLPLRLFAGAPDPLAAQAKAFAAVVETCLLATRCRGVTVWGLHDGRSWLGPRARPLLFDADLKPKPAHAAVLETLRRHAPRRRRDRRQRRSDRSSAA